MAPLLTNRKYLFITYILAMFCCSVFAQKNIPQDTAAIARLLKAASAQSNPDSSLKLLKQAAQQSIDMNYDLGAVQALVATGSKYSDMGKYPEAMSYAQQAVPYAEKAGDHSQQAFCYNLFGVIELMQGNYVEASRHYFKALAQITEMDSNSRRAAITIYTNIAALNGRLGQNDKKIYYLNKGEELARQIRMPADIGNTLLAGLLINKGNYFLEFKPDSALTCYAEVLDIARQMDIKKNNKKTRFEALALTNLGTVYLKKKEYDKAAQYCTEGIELAKDKYAYIAVAGKYSLAEAYRGMGRYKDAEQLLLATTREDAMAGRRDQAEMGYSTLAKLYKDTKEYQKALNYMDTLVALKDTLMNAEKARAINQMDISFKTSEKDKKIATQNASIAKQRIWLTIVTCGIAVLLLLATALYFIYRQKQQLQAEQIKLMEQAHKINILKAAVHSEDSERTRIARELHDGIGGMLSAAMMRFSAVADSNDAADYKAGINILSQMGDEIRKTAHNLMPEALLKQSLPDALQIYCDNMQEAALHIDFQYYGPNLDLSENFKLNIYRIIQELVKNIVQHANATHALVQLLVNDDSLSITVEDNGRGYDSNKPTSGIGLYNLQTRVSSLDGKLTIQSEKGQGTSVLIEFELPVTRSTPQQH